MQYIRCGTKNMSTPEKKLQSNGAQNTFFDPVTKNTTIKTSTGKSGTKKKTELNQH
jgi:hypothetical protein